MHSNLLPHDTYSRLKQIVTNGAPNHKLLIQQLPTLKEAHIYCKIHNLPGQVTGVLLEQYIMIATGMIKNNASLCVGDVRASGASNNLEIKTSNGGQQCNKFNFVQLRMNHDCDYLLSAYYASVSNLNACGELFMFKLSKSDMKTIILKHGAYAHGTVAKLGKITKEDLDDANNSKEYAVRPTYGDACWKELLQFRIDSLDGIGNGCIRLDQLAVQADVQPN